MKIDHEYTKEIVCPRCGNVGTDSFEFEPEEGCVLCSECGAKIWYHRIIDITYRTEIDDSIPDGDIEGDL